MLRAAMIWAARWDKAVSRLTGIPFRCPLLWELSRTYRQERSRR